ncbi:hypothetical protein QYE76_010926 [Lolium multiflorum]|uniref:Uncharacterized protein n=1 Tax=Lolium multiflorum TaxID=4521 RepID=A0AAD8TY16_LOLMU|nr:hypothetical protein QYE76_010926 [Lolium multiflorum]
MQISCILSWEKTKKATWIICLIEVSFLPNEATGISFSVASTLCVENAGVPITKLALYIYLFFLVVRVFQKKKLNHALVNAKYGPMHFLPKILLLPVLMVTFFLFSLMYLRYIIRGVIMCI